MTQVDQAAFSCAACGKQFRWKPELAGKTVKCKCGSPLKVPAGPGGGGGAPVKAPTAVAPGLAGARTAEVPRRSAAQVPSPPPPPARRAAPVQPHADDDAAGDDFDALAALAAQEASVAEDAAAEADSNFCANCRSRMSAEAILCTNCGFDRRKGKVLGPAKVKASDGRRLFGLLAPKAVDPKKPVDMMAPQGSFVVGVVASIGLAAASSILWFLVCWGFSRDVYILVALVGVGAGVGMQLGQKGYSTLGGITAALITIVVMFGARMAVVVALLMPIMERDRDWDKPKPTRAELARQGAEFREMHRGDRDNNAEVNPNEDPRVLAGVMEEVYKDFNLDPNFGNSDTYNRVHLEASIRAQTMPAERKQAYIDKAERKRERAELVGLYVDEYMDKVRQANTGAKVIYQTVEEQAAGRVDPMTPQQVKAELKTQRAAAKVRAAAERKQWQAEAAKEAEAARLAARKAAVDDGFEVDPAAEDAAAKAAAAKAATQPESAVALAGDEDAGDADAEGFDDALDEMAADADPGEGAEDGEDAGDAVATAAAPPGGAAAAVAAPGGATAAADEEADGDAVQFTLGMILFMIFFGGSFIGLFFIAGSVFLAYRTAAGATWG